MDFGGIIDKIEFLFTNHHNQMPSWFHYIKKHPIFKDDSPLVYGIVTVQPKN